MRIAVDISPTQSSHKVRGVGIYTRLLKDALQESKTGHSFYFFTRGEKLPNNINLVHYPYFDPFFLTLSHTQATPFVVTVHDLIPLAYPDKFPRGIRGEIKWQIQKKNLKQAKRIITDSNASKRDIQRIIGFNLREIDVIYLAPSPVFRKVTDKRQLSIVKDRYSLSDVFILYVGDVNWNKNIPGLIDAFFQVSKELNNVQLVFVGKAFLDEHTPEVQMINEKIGALQLEGSIRKLGYIPDEDLSAIYTLANCYVQPSFAEGFGFPILEAMACGCPVVTSNSSSLNELAGPSLTVDPYDSEDVFRAIMKIVGLQKRETLTKASIEWSKKFTWDQVARQTILSYEKAMEQD